MKAKIIFSNNKSIFSRLIRLFTSGGSSHCGVVIDNHVIDATPKKGIALTSLYEFSYNRNIEIIEIPVNPKHKARADKFIADILTDKKISYDFSFFKSFLNPFRKKPKFRNGKGLWCTELVIKYLIACGLSEFDLDKIFHIPPSTLYEILRVIKKQGEK